MWIMKRKHETRHSTGTIQMGICNITNFQGNPAVQSSNRTV